MSHENRKTLEELNDALRLLDHELEGVTRGDSIEIRAIGGYALMQHGIRAGSHALTSDIDSVTRDYTAEVQAAIRAVAAVASLEEDWLNNYNVLDNDPGHVESMINAEWVPVEMGLRNIRLSVGTLRTLTWSKILAADTADVSGRTQDGPDLIDLLRRQGVTSWDQFEREYPDPEGEYPSVRAVLRELFNR